MADSGFDQGVRFGEKHLHVNPEAQIKHFEPLVTADKDIPRDRFGNRLFTSPTEAYEGRDGTDNKAALLVSQDGESFIKANPGILNDIDKGLKALTVENEAANQMVEGEFGPYFKRETSGVKTYLTGRKEIDFDKDRKMELLSHGGAQSVVLLLHAGGEKYVVKVKRTMEPSNSVYQPYSNEMLQTQAIATDLHDELAAENFEMPTFLFASGQISCTKFVEGDQPSEAELRPKAQKLEPRIEKYVKEQQKAGNELWNHIRLDFYTLDHDRDIMNLRTNNVIKQPDGTFVGIDLLRPESKIEESERNRFSRYEY